MRHTISLESREDEPLERLTRLAAAAITEIEGHPEHHGDEQIIVLVHSVSQGPGTSAEYKDGIGMAGFGGSAEVIECLLAVAEALYAETVRARQN